MQEEVAKHTKKIYTTMKDKDHGFWEKVREIAIEILIIVFAVTLSIWLHGWSDHHTEQRETHEFLKGLKSDLNKDILEIDENKKAFVRVDSNLRYLETLLENNAIDTASNKLIAHYLTYDMAVTHPNIGRYDGFKSSGKLGAIENDSLKQNILVYYQQTMPGLNDGEDMVNAFQQKIMDQELNKEDKGAFRDLMKTFKMQGLLELTTKNMEHVIGNYDSTEIQARRIITQIDENN